MSEEPVTITEKEMTEIKKEIETVDDTKLAAVKKEALDEVAKLRAELESEKARLAELDRLNEELKKVRAAQEAAKATTKAIVPESTQNPAKPTVPDVPVLTHDEAWAVLGQSVSNGRWSGQFIK
jgi:septal ring factor EnvC (AmiA/AmiB activator)